MMNSIPTVTVNNDRSFVAKTEPFTCRQARANLAQTFLVKSFPQFFESKSDNKGALQKYLMQISKFTFSWKVFESLKECPRM